MLRAGPIHIAVIHAAPQCTFHHEELHLAQPFSGIVGLQSFRTVCLATASALKTFSSASDADLKVTHVVGVRDGGAPIVLRSFSTDSSSGKQLRNGIFASSSPDERGRSASPRTCHTSQPILAPGPGTSESLVTPLRHIARTPTLKWHGSSCLVHVPTVTSDPSSLHRGMSRMHMQASAEGCVEHVESH